MPCRVRDWSVGFTIAIVELSFIPTFGPRPESRGGQFAVCPLSISKPQSAPPCRIRAAEASYDRPRHDESERRKGTYSGAITREALRRRSNLINQTGCR